MEIKLEFRFSREFFFSFAVRLLFYGLLCLNSSAIFIRVHTFYISLKFLWWKRLVRLYKRLFEFFTTAARRWLPTTLSMRIYMVISHEIVGISMPFPSIPDVDPDLHIYETISLSNWFRGSEQKKNGGKKVFNPLMSHVEACFVASVFFLLLSRMEIRKISSFFSFSLLLTECRRMFCEIFKYIS